MKVLIKNQQNIPFDSKIRRTNSLGFGVNKAIELGDKGFFNAIKHLSNDGLNREIVISGVNSTTKKYSSATAILRTEDLEYTLRSSQKAKQEIDGFLLMSENIIKLVKKLASETGNISKNSLNEKSTRNELIKEGNELYKNLG